jgi:hypothetical protein
MSVRSSPKSLIAKSIVEPKKAGFSFAPFIILAIAGVIALLYVMTSKQAPKKVASKVVQKEVVEVVQPVEAKVEKIVSIADDRSDPHTAFPSMLAEVGDADAELASAFTYENLQDSMLTSGREAREAVKSRSAWSRFGARSNPEVWEQQLAEMKKEITASGQSLEQFMDSTFAPIPEQMAAFWKDSSEIEQRAEVAAKPIAQAPNRAALSEAPALTRDATQSIGKDRQLAGMRMKEALDARKRAKSLKLKMPELTPEQKSDVELWSADHTLGGIAKSLATV